MNARQCSKPTTTELLRLRAINDDDEFVREAYRSVLGRETDPAGFTHFRELLRNHVSRETVIRHLMNSTEALELHGSSERNPRSATISPRNKSAITKWFRSAFYRAASGIRESIRVALQIRQYELLQRKLDYMAHESSSRADLLSAKIDDAWWSLSEKIDAYTVNLGHNQRQLVEQIDGLALRLKFDFAEQRKRSEARHRNDVSRELSLANLIHRYAKLTNAGSLRVQQRVAQLESELVRHVRGTDEAFGRWQEDFLAILHGIEELSNTTIRAENTRTSALRMMQTTTDQILEQVLNNVIGVCADISESVAASRTDTQSLHREIDALADVIRGAVQSGAAENNRVVVDVKNTVEKFERGVEATAAAHLEYLQGQRTELLSSLVAIDMRLSDLERIRLELARHQADHLSAALEAQQEALRSGLGAVSDGMALSATRAENTRKIIIDGANGVQDEITRLAHRIRPHVFLGGDNVLVTEVEGFMIGVPGEEWRVASFLSFRGVLEPGLTELFKRTIRPGMVVVDIGANIGVYTLLAARHVGPGGRVISFEPTPRTFAILKDNIQVNGFLESGIIRFEQIAISDAAGTAEFMTYHDNSGHNSMFGDRANAQVIEVATISLDDALEDQPRVDFVKIDAEGAETLILRGMRRTLRRHPHIQIVMEFAPDMLRRAGVDPANFIREIYELGFQLERIDDETGKLHPTNTDELMKSFSANVNLVRQDLDTGAPV